MALSRVTTWNPGDTLTAAALGGEFDNILNNAVALLSPWTANMDANGKQLQNHVLETFAAAQTAATAGRLYYRSDTKIAEYDTGAAIRSVPNFVDSGGQLTLSGATLLFSPYTHNLIAINGRLEVIPDAGVSLAIGAAAASTAYNIYAYMSGSTMTLEFSATATALQAGTGVTIKSGDATRSFVGTDTTTGAPAWGTPVSFFHQAQSDPLTIATAAASPPIANTLYKDNVPKGWANVSYSGGVPALTDHFNAVSISDDGTGLSTITWNTDFANANYTVALGIKANNRHVYTAAKAAGTTQAQVVDNGGSANDTDWDCITMGDQ